MVKVVTTEMIVSKGLISYCGDYEREYPDIGAPRDWHKASIVTDWNVKVTRNRVGRKKQSCYTQV